MPILDYCANCLGDKRPDIPLRQRAGQLATAALMEKISESDFIRLNEEMFICLECKKRKQGTS